MPRAVSTAEDGLCPALSRFSDCGALENRYDGVVGAQTRGAIRAERARRARNAAIDAGDAETIRRFQRAVGQEADGVVGPETPGARTEVR